MSSASGMSSLVEIRDLSVAFRRRNRASLAAVQSLNLSIPKSGAIGVVGESGSGKSLTALAILGLLPKNAEVSGSVLVDKLDMVSGDSRCTTQVRATRFGMIMQDPTPSLNPLRTVQSQMNEAAMVAGIQQAERSSRVRTALESVRLPAQVLERRPHELSGGMNQRVAIAMALVKEPELLIADEPTTALDVTTQAGILGLLRNLRTELGMGLLLISHDIGVVYQLVDFIAVMYAGRLVEMGPTDAVITAPAHPYTQALISVLPARSQPRSSELNTIPGHLEPAAIGDTGCPFRTRCAYAEKVCSVEFPEPVRVGVSHTSYCWFSPDQMRPEEAGGSRQ